MSRPGAPLGKLYNKFHNWKSNKVEKSAAPSKPKKPRIIEKKNTQTPPESDQAHIRSLKFDNLTFEEKLVHWQGCITTRLNSFNTEDGKNKHIATMWPQYKEPYGYKLIEADFTHLYGDKNGFLDGMEDFADLMLAHVLNKSSIYKDTTDIELLKNVIENKDELHPSKQHENHDK